jgi:hypothetical protein
MFWCCSAFQAVGRPVLVEMPFALGPRHWGQFTSAAAAKFGSANRATIHNRQRRYIRRVSKKCRGGPSPSVPSTAPRITDRLAKINKARMFPFAQSRGKSCERDVYKNTTEARAASVVR